MLLKRKASLSFYFHDKHLCHFIVASTAAITEHKKPHSHKLTGQLTIFHDWEGVIHRNCQILITLNISLQGSKTSWDHFWTRFIDDHFESLAIVVVATIKLNFSETVVWNVLLIEVVALAKYVDNGCGSWLVVIAVEKLAQDECDFDRGRNIFSVSG